jgi:hypothetical protein
MMFEIFASECSVLPTKVAGSTSCNMASTICCWATAFASINNLDLNGDWFDRGRWCRFRYHVQSFKSLVQDLADSCSQHERQRDAKVAKLETNTMSEMMFEIFASECSVLPTKVAGSTSCNMASTICCWATAFASINNLDLTAILGSLVVWVKN